MIKIFVAVAVVALIIFLGASFLPEPQVSPSNSTLRTEVEADPASGVEPASIPPARTLNLSAQKLVSTPAYVFEETNLQELDLSNNLLEGSLPGEIRFLKDLKVLNLSGNQFTGLPAEIGQLENLEVLNVSNNKLTGLPQELANLKKLKLLNLSGNAYSEADLEVIKKGLPASVVILTE